MASTNVAALLARIKASEALVSTLKTQIEALKGASPSVTKSVCGLSKEAQSLWNENEALSKEVQDSKAKLSWLESLNGKKTVREESVAVVANSTNGETLTVPAVQPAKEQSVAKKEKKKADKPVVAPDTKSSGVVDENDPAFVDKLNFRIGRIVSATKHPDADTLYVESVDLAEETGPRTIVSGLANHVPLKAMQNRLAVFLINLKPAKLKGIASQGMIMCANDDGKVRILEVPTDSVPGQRVWCRPDAPSDPETQLNPKKKVWETLMPHFRTDKDGVACFKGSPWLVNGRKDGLCFTKECPNAQIK